MASPSSRSDEVRALLIPILLTIIGILALLLLFRAIIDLQEFLPVAFEPTNLLLFVFVLALLLFVSTTVIYSIHTAGRIKSQAVRLLLANVTKFAPEERKDLISVLKGPARTITGFSRAVIALTVLLVLGIALFAALILPIENTAREIVTPILGALTGLIAAITGFYYGRRAVEEQRDAGTGAQLQPAPDIEITEPQDGATVTGASLHVRGRASRPSGITKVEVQLDGGNPEPANTSRSPPGTATDWSIDIDLTSTPKGPHRITARVTDTLGILAEASIGVKLG